ncbi:MAG: ABC transporter permease subunit [Planctomycetales bacterium]|nr:ABC transporter permease subunit [Planctomycetales bacterium]
MNLGTICTIAVKELRDVTRDRKTLLFMLVFPTLSIPVLGMGMSRLVISQAQARDVAKVTVAADARSREALLGAARGAALSLAPRTADALRKLAPEAWAELERALGALAADPSARDRALGGAEDLPPEVRKAAEKLRSALDSPRAGLPAGERRALQRAAAAQKLLARTEFSDPAALPAAPSGTAERLPAGLRDDSLALRAAAAIASRTLHAAVVLPPDFAELVAAEGEPPQVRLYYDSTFPLSQEASDRVRSALDAYAEGVVDARLSGRSLTRTLLKPVDVADRNLAPPSRQFQAAIGGFLPYTIILFAFLGGLYPAIDLGAGEKERFTLETLLLTPATRLEIGAGKFLVVFLASMVSAVLSLGAMAFTLTKGILPPEMLAAIEVSLDARALALSLVAVAPVAATFAALLLAVSVYARSFKEAQTYAAPLQFLIIVPAIVSLLPDVQPTPVLGTIPVLNVSLLMREILRGELPGTLVLVTALSSLALAAAALAFAARCFSREEVLFRA